MKLKGNCAIRQYACQLRMQDMDLTHRGQLPVTVESRWVVFRNPDLDETRILLKLPVLYDDVNKYFYIQLGVI